MAKAAVNSTYSTVEIPLYEDNNNRLGAQTPLDAYLDNFIPEIVENRLTGKPLITLTKRDGTILNIAGTGATSPRGIFFWKETNQFYSVVGRNCYIYNVDTLALVTTLVNIVGSASTDVGMCTYLYNTNTMVLIITDGTTVSQISTANVVTVCVDADLPVPHLPTPVYFDGYLLLVKQNTGDCYNSDINNPMSWTPGNFITAEISADYVVGITTINNYFVLFGNNSIEYFYDAGNPTGTPFARNDTFVKLNGYVSSITKFGNKVYVIANYNNSKPDVFELHDFTLKSIGTESIRKWLGTLITSQRIDGNILSINGTDLYTLNTSTSTYYVNLANGFWGKLSFQQNVNTGFGLKYAVVVNSSVGGVQTWFCLNDSSPRLLSFSQEIYQDLNVSYTCTCQTNKQFLDTTNNKFYSSLSIEGNRGVNNNSCIISVSWTDDDYITFSTPRDIQMSGERPNIQQLGRARGRAWKFTNTSTTSCKLSSVKVDINMGTT